MTMVLRLHFRSALVQGSSPAQLVCMGKSRVAPTPKNFFLNALPSPSWALMAQRSQ